MTTLKLTDDQMEALEVTFHWALSAQREYVAKDAPNHDSELCFTYGVFCDLMARLSRELDFPSLEFETLSAQWARVARDKGEGEAEAAADEEATFIGTCIECETLAMISVGERRCDVCLGKAKAEE
jgi:hypothetical protein